MEAICQLEECHDVELGTGDKRKACATYLQYIAQSFKEQHDGFMTTAEFVRVGDKTLSHPLLFQTMSKTNNSQTFLSGDEQDC